MISFTLEYGTLNEIAEGGRFTPQAQIHELQSGEQTGSKLFSVLNLLGWVLVDVLRQLT